MVVADINWRRYGTREEGEEPVSRHRIQPWVWRMSGLTRDGTTKSVSRDQILRRQWGRGKIIFPVQLTTARPGNNKYRLVRLMPTIVMNRSAELEDRTSFLYKHDACLMQKSFNSPHIFS